MSNKRSSVIIDNMVLENLEKLSMLKIGENKKKELTEQLTEILAFVENLNELDTSNLDTSFSTLAGGTPMRDDIPTSNPNIAKEILSHAPNSKDDFFIVPKIIE